MNNCIGKVLWFNDAKGYGIIKYQDKDVFVHYSWIYGDVQSLAEGQTVSFELVEGIKGLQAYSVKKEQL